MFLGVATHRHKEYDITYAVCCTAFVAGLASGNRELTGHMHRRLLLRLLVSAPSKCAHLSGHDLLGGGVGDIEHMAGSGGGLGATGLVLPSAGAQALKRCSLTCSYKNQGCAKRLTMYRERHE